MDAGAGCAGRRRSSSPPPWPRPGFGVRGRRRSARSCNHRPGRVAVRRARGELGQPVRPRRGPGLLGAGDDLLAQPLQPRRRQAPPGTLPGGVGGLRRGGDGVRDGRVVPEPGAALPGLVRPPGLGLGLLGNTAFSFLSAVASTGQRRALVEGVLRLAGALLGFPPPSALGLVSCRAAAGARCRSRSARSSRHAARRPRPHARRSRRNFFDRSVTYGGLPLRHLLLPAAPVVGGRAGLLDHEGVASGFGPQLDQVLLGRFVFFSWVAVVTVPPVHA